MTHGGSSAAGDPGSVTRIAAWPGGPVGLWRRGREGDLPVEAIWALSVRMARGRARKSLRGRTRGGRGAPFPSTAPSSSLLGRPVTSSPSPQQMALALCLFLRNPEPQSPCGAPSASPSDSSRLRDPQPPCAGPGALSSPSPRRLVSLPSLPPVLLPRCSCSFPPSLSRPGAPSGPSLGSPVPPEPRLPSACGPWSLRVAQAPC